METGSARQKANSEVAENTGAGKVFRSTPPETYALLRGIYQRPPGDKRPPLVEWLFYLPRANFLTASKNIIRDVEAARTPHYSQGEFRATRRVGLSTVNAYRDAEGLSPVDPEPEFASPMRYYSVEEAERIMSISHMTLYNMRDRGQIEFSKFRDRYVNENDATRLFGGDLLSPQSHRLVKLESISRRLGVSIGDLNEAIAYGKLRLVTTARFGVSFAEMRRWYKENIVVPKYIGRENQREMDAKR